MKRSLLLIATLLVTVAMQGQSTFYVYKSDNSRQAVTVAGSKDITFGNNGSILYVSPTSGVTCSYATSDVDSISCTTPATGSYLTYSGSFDVAFSSADATSYSEVAESVTTTETGTNDFNDFIENYTVNNTITITYNGSSATYSGSVTNVAVAISGANVTVTSAKKKMKYILKGTTTNGSFKVYSDYKYAVELSGVSITNPTGPAINLQSGKTVYVILTANTTSTLCDGSSYAAATVKNGVTEDQKGTFFSEGQLIFSGTGALNITSLGGHAICSDDYVRVRKGTINILSSAKDGIHTNEKFIMGGGSLTINASDDGIDCGDGTITLNAGTITVNSVDEGITASYDSTETTIVPDINLAGGFIKITTTGEKGMGFKATGNITVTGGIAQITVTGAGSKGVNCDKNFTMSGGKITALTTGDVNSEGTSAGGFKSEGTFVASGGTIAVKSTGKGAKGINSTGNMTLGGADVTLISSGSDYAATTGDTKSKALTGDAAVTITGGTVQASSYNAALYSGGNFTVSGGTVQGYSNHTKIMSVGGTYSQTGGWVVTAQQ